MEGRSAECRSDWWIVAGEGIDVDDRYGSNEPKGLKK